MGGYSAQVQNGQTGQSSGKGPSGSTSLPTVQPFVDQNQPQPMAPGGNYSTSATSGQPTLGSPNMYPNTVGQWDNKQIQQPQTVGKGKGG